jgi:hypothetical protein
VKLDKDTWRLRYAELDGTPLERWPEGAKHYASEDAAVTLKIAEAQLERNRTGQNTLKDLPAQCRAYFALHLVSCWGLIADPVRVRALDQTLRASLDEQARTLVEAGLIVRDAAGTLARKMKPIEQRVFVAYKGQAPLTDGGKKGKVKPRSDRETLIESGDPLLETLAEFAATQKLLTGFVANLWDATKAPVHPRYGLAGTGRTTCSKPNIQNQPRKEGVRECFVPRPGWVYSSTDYNALELCTLAQACRWLFNFSTLGDAINSGNDPHLLLAARRLAIDYEQAKARLAKGDETVIAARQIAKGPNFGYPGGMGARKFVTYMKASSGEKISEEQARKLKAEWLAQWPEMTKYFEHVAEKVPQSGFGKITHLVTDRVRGGLSFTEACNSYFQGLAADGAKAALWRIVRECYDERLSSPLFDSRVVGFVHDEFLAEHKIETAPEAAERLAVIAREEMQKFCPDVKIFCEPALMERWSKKAKTVRDASGRLVVWQPKTDKAA